MSRTKIALILFALACVALSLLNASWIAPKPGGRLVLVAHRGVAQPIDRAAVPAGGCSAAHIAASGHNFIENTLFSMQNAIRFGARGLALDVQASADGHAVIFRDPTLECRTDGSGRVRDRPLAYLKTLDVGHGYTADRGRSFPLRSRGVGGMPTAEDVLRPYGREQLIFSLADPAAAEALVAAFARAGVAIADNHGFAGDSATLARLRRLTPAGWTLGLGSSRRCFSDYRMWGWTGLVPDSCRGTALAIPIESRWTTWGWPYRFLDRMAGAGARTLMLGEAAEGALVGIERPEQFEEVPWHYRGLLLIEDMHGAGRALRR